MEITTDRPKQSRISLEHWKTKEYNDAIRVCTVFGLEFKNLFEEPLRQGDKVDARTIIIWILLKGYELKETPIARRMGLDRSSIYFHRKRFLNLYQVDKVFRGKCAILGVHPD